MIKIDRFKIKYFVNEKEKSQIKEEIPTLIKLTLTQNKNEEKEFNFRIKSDFKIKEKYSEELFDLSFYIIKLSKDILSTSSMILDKLEAKIEAESTVELLKYLASTNAFSKDQIKINTTIFENKDININLPKKILINGESVSVGSLDRVTLSKILKYAGLENKDISIASDSYEDWIDSDDLKQKVTNTLLETMLIYKMLENLNLLEVLKIFTIK